MRYAEAGVDISRAEQAKERIRRMASRTFTRGVVGGIGAFGGLFALDVKRWHEPVLVSSTDGVGTKLKIAAATGIHSTVGGDLVNHCVNDILTLGAEPLFFLDYLALGRMDPDVVEQLVDGITRACHQADCALVGGETAELPDTYAPGEYDLAGFIVGAVDRERLVEGRDIKAGDRLIGLPSTGLHTNGYSLARGIVFDKLGLKVDSFVPEVGDTVAGALLRTHRSYLHCVRALLERRLVKGMAHITGGGIPGNLSRILPERTGARIDRDSWTVPSLFTFLQAAGGVPRDEMFRAFNMGIGLILACAAADADLAMGILKDQGEDPKPIGEIVSGNREVEL